VSDSRRHGGAIDLNSPNPARGAVSPRCHWQYGVGNCTALFVPPMMVPSAGLAARAVYWAPIDWIMLIGGIPEERAYDGAENCD